MTEANLRELLNLINELVQVSAPWSEKRDMLLKEATDEDKMNLNEFVGWFEEA